MKIYNTLSRKKEEFKLRYGTVKMYVCGPTVYDIAHLGHARAAVAFDVIRRYFVNFKKYKVTFVSNITDIDDKIIVRAAEEKISESELAEKIIPEYEKDYNALGVLPPDKQPRATEYIPQMIKFVEELMKKGAAYETKDGVYFRVSSSKKYGKLSGKKPDELQAGARVEIDREKENPADFVLWKAAKPGEPKWNGPKGKDGKPISGRPGWHIECSAMSKALLGDTFDIHGGGADLIFPHHEDEIAQSEVANGAPFARIWMHNGHVQINKTKMSKSLGNFFTVKEILAKYNPLIVRYFLLSTQYRMPIEFSNDLLEQAKNSLIRIHDFVRTVKYATVSDSNDSLSDIPNLEKARKEFEHWMDDDFNISPALSAIHGLISYVSGETHQNKITPDFQKAILDLMNAFDQVLGILLDPKDDILSDKKIAKLIRERKIARENKDFRRADEIRNELKKRGIELEDMSGGRDSIVKRSL